MAIPKVAVLAAALAVGVFAATVDPLPAQAFPSKAANCANCHAIGGSTTAAPSTLTPAAGATYTVAITLAANPAGGITGYAIVPVAPAIEKANGGNASAALTYSATMTAPTAAGTYKYNVYTNQGGTDPSGFASGTSYSITVGPATPVVVTTTTALAVTPASPVVAPASPTLTATVSGAGAAGLVEFFNGTASLGTSPVASGLATKSLTGIAAGSYSYKAVFTPTNAAAFTASTSSVVAYVVTAPPVAVPVASFTASAISGIAPLAVTLTDTSTGAPTSWLWTFGNGSSSNVQNPPVVTYTAAGTYTVTLIASNAGGASAAVSKTITVTDPIPAPVPTASFTSAISVSNPLMATMTDTSTGAPTSWSWDFGNGTTSTVQNPSVTYTTAGTYTVTLIASNANGASAPVTKTITVTAPTTSDATIVGMSPTHGEVGDYVLIKGSGFGTAGVVNFGTATATVSYWSSQWIVVKVPAGNVDGTTVEVTVTPTAGTASNAVAFAMDSDDDDDDDDDDDAPSYQVRLGGDLD